MVSLLDVFWTNSGKNRLSKWTGTVFLVILHSLSSACAHVSSDEIEHRNANINVTQINPITGSMVPIFHEMRGRYAQNSRHETESGIMVHVKTKTGHNHGCTPPVNVPKQKWIALIERGHCKFTDKIYNSAVKQNASAVVVYDNVSHVSLLTMQQNYENSENGDKAKVDGIVSVFITKTDGDKLAALIDNGTKLMMTITPGPHDSYHHYSTQINKTSVLFVSISFIVLMIISLAWLVFYYIQRFRYAHAKERLSKRLMHAAKKAISKMPARSLKAGDREIEMDFDQCAICIEGYKISEVIRILPCKHVFHKSCVDPWLIEQRSCPMCKTDILMAYGLQIHGSRESIGNIEVEGPSTSLGPFESISAEGLREFDHNGVEVIRFQPTQIDLHSTPVTVVTAAEVDKSPFDGEEETEDLLTSRNQGFNSSSSSSPEGAMRAWPDHAPSETTHSVTGEVHVHPDSCESSNLLQVAAVSLDSLEADNSDSQLLVQKSSLSELSTANMPPDTS